jgi:KDO2-lipid IV(A) lauroyltransferase
MMGEQRSRALDYAVYLLVRLAICLIQAVPYEAACRLAAGIAWLAYRVDRRHRQVAEDNLRHAFPGRYHGRELDALVQAVYRHFCNLLVEMAHLPRRLHPNNWRQYLDLSAGQPLVECLISGRPLLIVTGHFGNWEMAGYVLGLLGFQAHAVARELDNPYLEDFLRRFRESTGQRLLSKRGDFDRMQEILDAGGLLATLGDQDAGQRGLYVDFFGRPASTHKAMALLCLQQGVPLIVMGTPKVAEPMSYRVIAADLIRPEEYADRPDAVRAVTQRLTTALEGLARLYPEQYFWLHRRWKHQPKAGKGHQVA